MPAEYVATRDLVLADLERFPGNARRGNLAEIRKSIRRHGQYRAICVRDTGHGYMILAGNHTADALAAEGHETARCDVIQCTDDEARRINLADNRLSDIAMDDGDALAELLSYLDEDYEGTGWSAEDVEALLTPPEPEPGRGGNTDPDATPEPPAEPLSALGDLYLLGPHRLLCGDSTDPAAIKRVTDGLDVALIHADPPYGMGKEADGVLNDNLYGPKLDAFQMQWWNAWLPVLAENGSAYIWGNAADLWRLWWTGGLCADPDLLVRNEIVWDKGSTPGMHSEAGHSYSTVTERCLFLMRGQQFLGNQNKGEYWEGYEPLRSWLCGERDKVGWVSRDINALTGTQMAGHWFSQSQFAPISVQHYRALQEAAAGRAFTKDYDELFRELFPDARSGGNAHRRDLAAELREQRTYFDNAHDIMSDVWTFPRVTGDERQGHATPKPVAMIERAMLSSSQPGGTIGVPFGGSGPDFIAAHRLDRIVAGIELEPRWVDVICRRYQEHTGIKPERVLEDGTTEPVSFTGK